MDQAQIEAGYLKLLDQKRQYLKEIFPLDSKFGWYEDAYDKGVTIHAHIDPATGLKIIRSHVKINAPKEKVVEIGENPVVLLEWDKTLADIKMIYRAKEYYIFYTLVKKLPLVVQRESVLLAKFYYEDDGTVLGISCSIDHPDVPRSKDRIRGTVHLVGIVMQPDPEDPNVTDYTYILHVNPEGWIPVMIFNWFANGQGFNVKPFGEYVEKKWKQELEEKNKKVKAVEEKKNMKAIKEKDGYKKEGKEVELIESL